MFYRGPLTPRVGESPRFLERSQSYSQQALGARSAMRPDVTRTESAPKTVGGAISAGFGGYAAATALDMANPALGAGAMILGYLLS